MNEVTQHLTRQNRAPMPTKWIGRIFAEMQGNYGSKFTSMWATGEILPDGSDAGLTIAMQVWGQKLAGFTDRPEAIKAVLSNLPAYPPTLPEFVALCRAQAVQKPIEARIAYTPTAEDMARAKDLIDKAAAIIKADMGEQDPLRWCRKPGSFAAMATIYDEATNRGNRVLAGVLRELIADGICTPEGKLLRMWKSGEWVSPQ